MKKYCKIMKNYRKKENLKKEIIKIINKKRILLEKDINNIINKFSIPYKEINKILNILKQENVIKKVYLDEKDLITPFETFNIGYIMITKTKSSPILSNKKIEELLKE